MITQREFQAALSGYTLIDEQVKQAAERYIDKFGGAKEHITSINEDCYYGEFLDGSETIDISTEAYYCGCCGPDYEYYSIPLSYIWDENWEQHAQEAIDMKKLADLERQAAKKAEEEKKREEKRYAEYLKMKEEYENE